MASDGTSGTDRSTPPAEDERAEGEGVGHERRYDEPPRLECRTVRRADEPDRLTVYPADATGIPRMSTWLSVDASCVVDLESVR
ncbi:DUF7511 domain-containing protein [Natronomonas sp.]|uniref:DUF7511 domain-containing protein n=1 Tax=Natronomonas sp. TaxID=2184060 RepID=UPI002FC3DEBC